MLRIPKCIKNRFSLRWKFIRLPNLFPSEEKYSLTDQIRRSSRSVSICLLEAYRKKIYPAHFVAKITDSDMENSETSGWLDFALACKYINTETFTHLMAQNEEIGRLLGHMLQNPEKY